MRQSRILKSHILIFAAIIFVAMTLSLPRSEADPSSAEVEVGDLLAETPDAIDTEASAADPRARPVLAKLHFPADWTTSGDYTFKRFFSSLTFNQPILITSARDGSGRLFVVERPGVIRVFQPSPDVNTTRVFLDISDKVSTEGEKGLLGLAFPPDFASTGYFYVHYNSTTGNRGVFARYKVSADPDVALPDSEKIILEVRQPSTNNHKGGSIQFGPDGFLYLALGDRGGAGDPPSVMPPVRSRSAAKFLPLGFVIPFDGHSIAGLARCG